MALLSNTPYGQNWLKNFDAADQKTAKLLIDNLMVVGSAQLNSGMIEMLDEVYNQAQGKKESIALYAEREVEKINHEVQAFFPNSEKGRAIGLGVQPVIVKPEEQDVGSEGIFAALITKFCKAHQDCFSHPGPDQLRTHKVRKIVVVTDFIGSGRRLHNMLEAFFKVASIRSWHSYSLVSFHIIAYSATEFGMRNVKNHTLKPEIHTHVACPVIDEAFEGEELGLVKKLCKKYPIGTKFPLGFRSTGALIAFPHGIPNNSPEILHSTKNGWCALFPKRSTATSEFDDFAKSEDFIANHSEKTLKIREARHKLENSEGRVLIYLMLVLETIRKGIKATDKISASTHVSIKEVKKIIETGIEAKWITHKNSLTTLGRRELKHYKLFNAEKINVVFEPDSLYFPNQLRTS